MIRRTSRTLPHPLKKSSRSLGLIRLDSCMQKTVRMSRSSGVNSGERTRLGGVREWRRRRSLERDLLLRRRSFERELRRRWSLERSLDRPLRRRSRERLLRRRARSRELLRSRFDFFDLDLERDRERRLVRRSRLFDLLRSLRLFLLQMKLNSFFCFRIVF